MQWPDLIQQIGVYCQQEQADPSFVIATPAFVNNAELRIYRELDLAAASGQNFSMATVANDPLIDFTRMTGVTIDSGTVTAPVLQEWPVVVETLSAKVGARWIPFQLTSLNFLEMAWPDETAVAPPSVGFAYYSMLDGQTAHIRPVPDAIYPLRVTGTWRPAPMSAANPKTWLGDNIPDLLLCAVIFEAMAYQRDFGAASDNPQAAMSWEARYQEAKRTAMREEALRKGLGPDFQPQAPAPLAKPPPLPPQQG